MLSNAEKEKNRFNYVSILKIAGLFAILLFYCLLFYANFDSWPFHVDLQLDEVRYPLAVLESLAIPLMFYLNGFDFAKKAKEEKPSTLRLFGDCVKKTLLPLFFFGILWLIPVFQILDLKAVGRDPGFNLIETLTAFFTGNFLDIAWVLMVNFWLCLVFVIFRHFIFRKRGLYLLPIAILLTFICLFFFKDITFFKLDQIGVYILIFYLGIVTYNHVESMEKLDTRIHLIFAVLATIIVLIISIYSYQSIYLKYFSQIIGPIGMFIFAFVINRTNFSRKISNFFTYKFIVNNWLTLYLFMTPFLHIFFNLIYNHITQDIFLGTVMNFIFTLCVTILISIIATYIKKLYKYLKGKIDAKYASKPE